MDTEQTTLPSILYTFGYHYLKLFEHTKKVSEMKFKVLKTASVGFVLLVSNLANASIITHSGYTHDTTTEIVAGGGLEWLKWDFTKGNISKALNGIANTYSGGGWTLASNVQMAALFNGFGLGNVGTDENQYYNVRTAYDFGTSANDPEHQFNTMFGISRGGNGGDSIVNGVETDGFSTTSAFFGSDADGDGFYNVATVTDDWVHRFSGSRDNFSALSPDQVANNVNSINIQHGVALVRVVASSVASIPEPSIIALFGLGLVGLGFVRRRRQA